MENKNMEVDKEVEMEAGAIANESEATPVTLIVEDGMTAAGGGSGTDCAKHVVVLSNAVSDI